MIRGSSFETVARTKRSLVFFATALFVLSLGFQYASAAAPSEALAASSASLSQCANDPAPSPSTDGCDTAAGQWENGNLGASKSIYFEGDSIPYRLTLGGLDTTTSHTVTIEWDTTKSGKHALDYLTTFDRTVADADPCLGVSGCGSPSTFAIPADPQVTGAGVTPVAGNFTLFGGTITGVSAYSGGATFPNGDNSRSITITFDANVANPVLAWGGHIAARKDWGLLQSAVNISGSPYHMRLLELDGSGGNQDRSLSAAAVVFPASITIVKNTTSGNDTFPFTAGPSPLSDFSLTTSGGTASETFSDIINFTTYTVTEGSATGWVLQGIQCAGGGTPTINLGTGTVTINLAEGQNVVCQYTNAPAPAPALTIVKNATETSYNAVGQTIHYSITATNSGNTTIASATITDPNAILGTCTPANGSSLAPGATIVCAATHVVTQADIDAGHYLNQACVDDGAGGAAAKCATADVPSVPAPALTIVKNATETSYNAVGQTIHYSITATNSGNTTIASATITDPNAILGTCTPANGSSLAPGATIVCAATHVVTQADIDAGHYLNQACVDDGAGGAAAKCATADVPSAKNPALTIDKTSPTVNYDAVGDVITYSITATNSGNTTIASATITDPNAILGTCTPANGSSLAPGATIVCAATHTVTQADIDAGHYLNTACVDDGPNGAPEVCHDATVPAVDSPALTIDKTSPTVNYDAVGDVITYSITATNSGNTTIASATITDPNAILGTCTPANGSSLAPGATIVCAATHTVTQADIDAGHYLNTACVDDGPNGAPEVCHDATVPAVDSPALTIDKTSPTVNYDAVGDVITYSITATNSGNTTIASATITDPNAILGTCTPANGSSLAPGATIVCAATHTVTQADIDAGHYLNTACVDDGPNGAPEVCHDADVPAVSNALLTIVKDATETSYDAVGQTIHYSITATNSGNTTLSSVTITDPKAILGTCTPANGSSLAPGATLTCAATHVVTQADIDAGHYLNTACVSATDATATCDDADVPSVSAPALTIVKDVTESSYGTVGDVLHYSVTATNSGNTTLASVTITDPNAILGICTPANGSPLAPGDTLTCNARHTVTQADIDAGHYLNTACVDATGATQACDSADVVAATLTIDKSNNAPIETLVLPDGTAADLPTAKEGSTVTYTLTYQVGTVAVDNGIITDVLPAGVTYVAGSASSNGVFIFASYDTGSRTLTWTAESVSEGGSLTYKVTIDTGADILVQPLTNHATIDSDQTSPDTASSDVFVPAPPAAETQKPTPPPTDTLAQTGPSNPGSNLALILAALALLVLGISFVTPVPAAVRRRNRR